MKGKFIVLYGSNNVGKSVQVNLLASHLVSLGKQVARIKYPIYDLAPTGPFINAALRKGKVISEADLQKYFAQNRRDFEPTLKAMLSAGITVIAECYVGTGLAWGLTRDVSLKVLEDFNKGLLKPDCSMLLDGDRFKNGKEKGHRNEEIDDELWNKNRKKYLFLAKRYHWRIVNSYQEEEKVQSDILKVLKEYIV